MTCDCFQFQVSRLAPTTMQSPMRQRIRGTRGPKGPSPASIVEDVTRERTPYEDT